MIMGGPKAAGPRKWTESPARAATLSGWELPGPQNN